MNKQSNDSFIVFLLTIIFIGGMVGIGAFFWRSDEEEGTSEDQEETVQEDSNDSVWNSQTELSNTNNEENTETIDTGTIDNELSASDFFAGCKLDFDYNVKTFHVDTQPQAVLIQDAVPSITKVQAALLRERSSNNELMLMECAQLGSQMSTSQFFYAIVGKINRKQNYQYLITDEHFKIDGHDAYAVTYTIRPGKPDQSTEKLFVIAVNNMGYIFRTHDASFLAPITF